MPRITPFLWFDSQAEEAARFYTSLFENSQIDRVTHYPQATEGVSGKPAGSVMTVEFRLDGQPFVALNGGPQFPFSEAVSFTVDCRDQAEVDRMWEALTSGGGEEGPCGWLKDRFGLSWQVVPRRLHELMADDDPQVRERATRAMLGMRKLDVAELERAARGE